MKNLFTLLTVIFITTGLLAQEKIPQAVSPLEKNIEQSNKIENNNSPKIRKYKGLIWVQDSVYTYNSDGDSLLLTERSKVVERDIYGHSIEEINNYWDTTFNTWVKKDTISITYYNSDMEHTYLEKSWNSDTQQWSDTTSFFGYNESGLRFLYIFRIWDYETNTFSFGDKIKSSISDNQVLYDIIYDWNTNSQEWRLAVKYDYSYNTDGSRNNYIISVWDTTIGSWINSKKYIYVYDDNGKTSEYICQKWDTITGDWINSWQNLFFYDTNDYTTRTMYQIWDTVTSSWTNFNQSLYYYNDNGFKTLYIYQTWDSSDSSWQNVAQYLYDYDGDKLIHYYKQVWKIIDSSWQNNYQYFYSYDTSGNMILSKYQTWNTDTDEWENNTQWLYTYDSAGNKTEFTTQYWNAGTDWKDLRKEVYYWSQFDAVSSIPDKNVQIKLYPNPTNNLLNIVCENNIDELQILDISGKILIKKYNIDKKITLNIADLPSNIYLIKLMVNGKETTQKFIKK